MTVSYASRSRSITDRDRTGWITPDFHSLPYRYSAHPMPEVDPVAGSIHSSVPFRTRSATASTWRANAE